ncbi:MEDS domain-containing protein [Asanoa sp. NPDC050611]|uniref:MEDS domain-containing protein n=1 Tax=Asanoa sp. NPDC050611 TaxID=3157098 RepID=UPI0033DEA2C5
MHAAQAQAARPTAGRHLCWAYADLDEFVGRARGFLAEGRAAGAAVRLVGDDLPDIDGVAPEPVSDVYGVVDPAATVAYWADALSSALAAGHTGLRVVGEVTPLVRSAAQVAAFAAYEHRIDRLMARNPLSGLCGYDRRVVDPGALSDLACLHEVHNLPDVSFRLHAVVGSGDLAISGELDVTGTAALARVLDQVSPAVIDGELVVDAGSLDFVDHRSLLQLASYARGRGATAVLRTPMPAAARLVELLRVPGLRVEAR